ncbi:hypothetical protein V3C99_000777 [Haemonchus contortus]
MLCLVVVLLLLVPFSSQADIFSLMKAQPLHNYFKPMHMSRGGRVLTVLWRL